MADYQSINEQVQTLFEESNQPNMYLPQFGFYQTLETVKPMSLPREQSIKRMINFINIVLYLKTNKHLPCQIKFHHVGCDKENNWGLKHVICYRAISCPKHKDMYDNVEFLYHSDQDNELVWNLGKIWLRFYCDRKVTVIDKNQCEIDQVIDNSITDQKINKILKKMLKVKKDQRVTFQKFIQDEVFLTENFQQNLYSSICLHFQMISKNEKVAKSMNGQRQIRSPYEEEVFRRDLEESLEICALLEKSIKIIRDTYEKSVEIEFHVFMIKVEAYCILKKLDEKKIANQVVDYTAQQKKTYSKFVTKMLTLKHELQRKMRMQIFTCDSGLNQNQRCFLIPTSEMTINKMHPAFKHVTNNLNQIIINYYLMTVDEIKRITQRNMSEIVKRDKLCQMEKLALTFLLTRLCLSIFSELRSYIFEEVVKRSSQSLKIFTLKDLLNFVDTTNDYSPLRKIRERVFVNGLQSGSSNTKIQFKSS